MLRLNLSKVEQGNECSKAHILPDAKEGSGERPALYLSPPALHSYLSRLKNLFESCRKVGINSLIIEGDICILQIHFKHRKILIFVVKLK